MNAVVKENAWRQDLPFEKGEVLYIETVSPNPNWYRAKNAIGRRGFIPYNFVIKWTAEVKLHAMPWLHEKVTREQAEDLLKPHEDGSFLVRESHNYAGDYTLSVRFGHEVGHYRIRCTDDGNFTIDDVTFFKTLTQLVEYEEGADGLCTRLVKRLERKEGTLDFFAFDVDPNSFRKGLRLLLCIVTITMSVDVIPISFLVATQQLYGRQLRSSSMNLLVVPKANLKSYGERSFKVAAPRLWNALPKKLKLIK
ncbi:hypothetical protein ACROYT_G027440 [Oculina patagonica]